MNRNQEIVDKIEHGGKDTLTDDDVRYIQECFEVQEEFDSYPNYSRIADVAFVCLLLTAFVLGAVIF
jgi:hypothetical protein